MLAVVIFPAITGCTCAQIPLVFGPSCPTAHRRFTEWLEGEPDLAEKTHLFYDGHIRNYLTPQLGRARLDKLTSCQVEAMFAEIEENDTHILECKESEDVKVRASAESGGLAPVW